MINESINDNGKNINSIICEIMKNVDYDKNGLIEFEEFLKATIDKKQLTSESNLLMAFSIFFLGDNGGSNLKTKSIKEKRITYKEIHRTIFGETSTKINLTKDILEELGKSLNDEIGFEEFKSIIVKDEKY
jgi:calcium-dependent protein kinase